MIQKFIKMESASGILLLIAAILAMLVENSFLSKFSDALWNIPLAIQAGDIKIHKPLLLWVNDGLMAIFFFLVGLELKRELIEGELADKRNIILPGVGAIGGMLVPAFIYFLFNYNDPVALKGWAIPAATDIAFALGILALLGSRVPISLKIFLTSLAIFDDIGAILIIAFFYTENISSGALIIVAICLPILYLLNRRNICSITPYIFVGLIMWCATLKSGVHATLAGVILALFIPLKDNSDPEFSPLKNLEHDLHTAVAFIILPIFAFANAGIDLSNLSLDQVMHGAPLGIAVGLFLGKQLGIFCLCWLAIKIKLARLPKGMTYASLYGTAILCGVGFTMSLFISSLAFEETGVDMLFDDRIGIVLGSVISGIVGYFILRYCLNENSTDKS